MCVLLTACGDDDRAPALPMEALPNAPTGEPHSLVYQPDPGGTHVATVTHTLRTRGGRDAPDAAQPGGSETWVVTSRVTTPTTGDFALTIDGDEKRSLETSIEAGNTHWSVRGVSRSLAIYRIVTDPGLAGLGGVSSWLPTRPVRVGETWPLPHFVVPTDLPSGLVLRPATTVRLESVGTDGAWHLRLEARTEIKGTPIGHADAVPIEIIDRVRGTAVIDGTSGQPRSFSIHCERMQVESGRVIQEAQREITGTVVRVELNAVAPK